MTFKEKFFTEWFSLRMLFLWGNIFLFVLFTLALLQDNVRGWKVYQQEYQRREIARSSEKLSSAKTDEEKAVAQGELNAARGMKLEIRQMWVQNSKAVDRCITCHLGYDPLSNSTLTTP